MMWKVIGTFIVVVQLAISLPVEQDTCNVKKQVCGDAYKKMVYSVCSDEYKNCPLKDDGTMPEMKHGYEIVPACCKVGCSVSYLKTIFCDPNNPINHQKLIYGPNPYSQDQRVDLPMWMYLFTAGEEFSNNWLLNYYLWSARTTQKPIYQ